MNAKQIYNQTMPFNMAKLVLGLITVGLSLILLAILEGIGWLFGSSGIVVTFFLWLAGAGAIRFFIMHYMGYLVKAGHIAVVTEAVIKGVIPENQVEYGKQKVTERFVTSNAFFVIDNLVTASVRQIQRGIEKMGGALDFIPGIGVITNLAQFFVSISLGYVDECCLGYTFYKKEQGAFESATDGVVIYAQNWKELLKSAVITMIKVLVTLLVLTLLTFLVIGMLFKALHWSTLIAFLIACLIVWVIKFAFIDSYIMINMMTTYMSTAETTEISYDLYDKLCGLSGKFKELFNKAKNESVGSRSSENSFVAQNSQKDTNTKFCGKCGAKNSFETKFCTACGDKI
ncbi:zinc ribbon domain-containing protein [Fusibacter ferrireducens]|uniref:Zinc ribbon domain-containing protein n=1 Tax=Fusibacter ferrireducens TaxID=2785058 RepID=A0ABR9ZUS8_9FIRM|nr:zinc ribbon domain-containing protein [Fusibacter ferrireducens]MBF4693334.1 zinc ribbon domain-containing protein [Fusibacter ferrireducens]